MKKSLKNQLFSNSEIDSQFQRGLKCRHISLIALGGIIGSSYFLGTGYVLNEVGPAIFLAYAIGGIITFLTMSCLAELTLARPSPGSFITYARDLISPHVACGIGWSYWVCWVIFVTAECLAAGILMEKFVPALSIHTWTMIFGMFITLINFINVSVFGEVEFWLALIKIALLISFSLLAIALFFGWIGTTHEVIGTRYLLKDGGLFPHGLSVLFLNMVILLANFQGSEIIGLSAAESAHPEKSIPKALEKISLRIIGLYLLPTFLLALIFPWQEAGLSGNVFSATLLRYGLFNIAHLFSFLVIAGAISCANSGLYATVRSLHALALKDMAPDGLKKLNARGIPARATLVTIAAMWIFVLTTFFFQEHQHQLYANLLAMSGFTGSMCWISICWSQLRLRRELQHAGTVDTLTYKIFGFPWLTHLAIWLQIGCLCVVAWSPTLRPAFYFGLPAFLIPLLLHKWINRYSRIS